MIQRTAEEEAEIERAQLGMDAELFKKSKLYAYLSERAVMEGEEYIKELIEADPADEKANRLLRQEIAVRKKFFSWIDEAISSGFIAVNNLEQMDAQASED